MNNKSGFTLAEVIITLTIIGVVAAMAIPAMIQDIQDQQLKTAWKQTYSQLFQAFRIAAINAGGRLSGFNGSDVSFKDNYLKPYLSHTKADCDTLSQTSGNCWHNSNSWKTLNGADKDFNAYASLLLINGSLLGTGCWNADAEHDVGYVIVDVNGWKGPNIVSKDIFGAYVSENGNIKAFGSQGDSFPSATDCKLTGTGWGCSAKYIYQ